MTPAPHPFRWLLQLPISPAVGMLALVVAAGFADLALLPMYWLFIGPVLLGGASYAVARWQRRPLPWLECFLGLGGTMTALLFWLNTTFHGPVSVQTYPIHSKNVRTTYDGAPHSGEASVEVLVGEKWLIVKLTRTDTARIRRATACEVSVAPGLLGVDIILQYRLR